MNRSFWPWVACAAASLLSGPAALAETRIIDNRGTSNNRVEVTGNNAENVRVRCAERSGPAAAPGANVNSVNIEGSALQGRTVIVTGRNARDVDAQVDCSKAHSGGAQVNVNSVNIR